MTRYVVTLCMAFAMVVDVTAQTIDEKIGNAMNGSDWFALDSIYRTSPKDSINPFLEVFSRCMLGNRFNRPDVSISAFQELLNTQSENLGLGNLVSVAHMFGMDLSREGYNAEAASMIDAIVSQTRQYLDSATVDGLAASAQRYAALAEYKPYQIVFPDGPNAFVPFSIVPVGPKEKESVLMHLVNSSINGISADIIFDTGAGMNMISPEMAERYNLVPLEGAMQTVAGIGQRNGYIAVAGEIAMGDVVVRDVPFVVASMSSDNEEADKYIDSFSIVVGSELMLKLKELTLDFTNSQIIIPTAAAVKGNVTPNMCFSSGMNLLTKGSVLDRPCIMCLDSGYASFGSLDSEFYVNNKEYVERYGTLDTIRSAGLGGVTIVPCYCLPSMPVMLGGSAVAPSGFVVNTRAEDSAMGYGCIIGLRTLMLWDKVNFNMVDFVVSAEKQINL